jgi:phasin family protein
MTDPKESLATWNHAAYDAALGYARAGLESAEQLLRLNLETARTTLEAQSRVTRELLEVRDPQAMMASRAKLAETSLQQAAAYASSVYEIVSQMQGQLTEAFDDQLAKLNSVVAGGAEALGRTGPGGDVTSTALKSTIAATNAMVQSLTQAQRQFASLSEASLRAVTQQMVRPTDRKV